MIRFTVLVRLRISSNLVLFSWQIIDTPHFQRLRGLKVLPSSEFIFPSANHNFLDMSLCNLITCDSILNCIKYPHRDIDKSSVLISSLVYNLGRCPFQSAFANFMTKDKCLDYDHVDTSIEVFHSLLEHKGSVEIKETQLEDIHSILKGRPISQERKYLSQIVNNKDTKIDLTKIMENLRDTVAIGIPNKEYDYNIPFLSSRIINGEISFNSKVSNFKSARIPAVSTTLNKLQTA